VTKVEKIREESNGKSFTDLAEQLKIRSYFLIGERNGIVFRGVTTN
jgi:hypothetical protein